MRFNSTLFGAFLLTLSVVTTASAGPTNDRDHVVIRLYNTFGLPNAAIEIAQSIAAASLRRAGIVAGWRDCVGATRASVSTSDLCGNVLESDEVVVRVVTAPRLTAPPISADTLGYSYVDTEKGNGALATVFGDRVVAMATRAGADTARLLGEAIAHEVGHLLLGSNAHSSTGLMRARWLDSQLRGNSPRDWEFSKHESEAMRANLSARRRMETEPATVTARKADAP